MDLQQVRSRFENHVRSGMFKPVARHLGHDADDRLQEGVALTWKLYRKQAELGHEVEPALLVHACRLRARDLSRKLASDRTQKLRDVCDPRNQISGRVALLDIDANAEGHGHALGMAGATCTNPTAKLDSAIDLSNWLDGLSNGDRRMLELRAEGFTWKEASHAMGLPLKTAYDRCQKLGMELARRGGVPAPAPACA